jgi:hypothetical protein
MKKEGREEMEKQGREGKGNKGREGGKGKGKGLARPPFPTFRRLWFDL